MIHTGLQFAEMQNVPIFTIYLNGCESTN